MGIKIDQVKFSKNNMEESSKEDLLKTYIFNKSKKKTVIFIHGLFGNSGFWLPFLPIFKNFKIILLNIDYSKLFENDLKKNNFVTYLDSILKKDEEYVTVAHSFGTIISQFFSFRKIKTSYEICPIKSSVKNNKNKFIKEINSLTNYTEKEIHSTLEKASVFLSNDFCEENKFLNKKKYIPKVDSFFENSLINNVEYFEGDHFNITNSLSMINKDLSRNQ
tara:strand:+ start:815 stop:1474 length:660 start_codon:yes stop_codon:yes gene_type:complete